MSLVPNRPSWLIAALAVFMTFSAPSSAQIATMVEDLNRLETDNHGHSFPKRIYDLGNGKALFFAGPQDAAEQVWVTDGSAVGTELLSLSGSLSVIPATLELGASAGLVFWLGSDGVGDCPDVPRLMRTNGTRAGTLALTGCDQFPLQPTVLGDGRVIFFTLSDQFGGRRLLWVVEGESTAPLQLADLGFLETSAFHLVGEALLFSVRELGLLPAELWRTDGSPAGTRKVTDLPQGFGGGASTGSRLYFLTSVAAPENQLWMSDGTAAGTVRVPTPTSPGFLTNTRSLQAAGGKVYFVATTGAQGRELWVADGTSGGTRALTAFPGDIELDQSRANLEVFPLGGRVLFVTSTSEDGREMWVSDGNPASTTRLADACTGGCDGVHRQVSPVVLGDRLLWITDGFGIGENLWTSDGTVQGTAPLAGACPPAGCQEMADLFVHDGEVFYVAWHPAFGHELWTTDAFSTRRLTNFPQTSHLSPFGAYSSEDELGGSFFGRLGDLLLFGVDDGVHGVELWKSDGSLDGASLVTDLVQQGSGAEPRTLTRLGGAVVFQACVEGLVELRRAPGFSSPTSKLSPGNILGPCQGLPFERGLPSGDVVYFADDSAGLWRTDGSPAGTFQLDDSQGQPLPFDHPSLLLDVNGTLFWIAGFDHNQIWTSDGTSAGTHLGVDLSQLASQPRVTQWAWAFEGRAYFITYDDTHGNRLWTTDATADGTQPVLDPDDFFFSTGAWTQLGGELYFFAGSAGTGAQLWKTDGTSGGTQLLRDFGYLSASLGDLPLTTFEGHLYYFASVAPGRWGLWKSDGTTTGAQVVGNFDSSLGGSTYNALVTAGNKLFFVGEDPLHGKELWTTEGSFESTSLVRDIAPGLRGSNIFEIVAAGDRVFFLADDRRHGYELWVSDGTAAGTRLVHDLATGPASSAPRDLTLADNRLYFSADDGIHGRELWVIDLAADPTTCPPTDSGLCLQNNRFRVEIDWRDFQGNTGRGTPVPLTADTGYFWFFNETNVETIVKVLDGRPINEHFWTFYGALSNVEYTMTVTDAQTGLTQRYFNPPRQFASVGDTESFGPNGASLDSFTAPREELFQSHEPEISSLFDLSKAGSCAPSSTRLCLNNGRFAVEANWTDFQGNSGVGMAEDLTSDTGYFWFFRDTNVEVVLKVLDGRPLNGKFWVFYGALSNVEYTLTVTDTETGNIKTYFNPSRRFGSVGDTGAF